MEFITIPTPAIAATTPPSIVWGFDILITASYATAPKANKRIPPFTNVRYC